MPTPAMNPWRRRGLGALALDALDDLSHMTRGSLIRLARDLVRIPWVLEALAEPGSVVVLGRFDLEAPDGVTPWPSIVLQVGRPAPPRTALVCLYPRPDERWECVVLQDRPPNWGQYRGQAGGPPGVINGESTPPSARTTGAARGSRRTRRAPRRR